MSEKQNCPCGSGLALDACCGPFLSGGAKAPTAEALMRSRYTAYVQGDIDYVEATLSAHQRRSFDREGAQAWSEKSQWQGLEIHSVTDGGEADDEGAVEFTASFEVSGVPQKHRELARFEREDGRWVYEGGDVSGTTVRRESPKVGRNEPCPCGSGKKFKKCCGR